MYLNEKILVGKNKEAETYIVPRMANRHGLITGASGSGKTTTVKVLAESFSAAGVPVFVADVKGDLGGCAVAGESSDKIIERLENLKVEGFDFKAFPVHFWDIYQQNGHPIRTTIKSVGPQILSMMLGLSEAQEGVLSIVFRVAEDEDFKLIDLKDLRLVLQHVGDNKNDYITKYGNITTQSVGVIQRSLLTLEDQGANLFFGEPELEINDFMMNDNEGCGYINILHAVELFHCPDLYASFLLWLLTDLFKKLPEVGDLDKPKIVFFFDEAHLLFNNMPNYRLKQIVQIVKLIRSRGIGLYFISQSPTDIPDEIIAQLGNRIQHTLRAYTPSEQKSVKAAANAFRVNPKFDTEKAILELGTGEALVSFQNEKGEPGIVERVFILPPQSYMGAIDDFTRNKMINNSNLCGKYDEALDSESAYEVISAKMEEKRKAEEEERERIEEEKRKEQEAKEEEKRLKEEEKQRAKEEKEEKERLRQEEKERKEAERLAEKERKEKEKKEKEEEKARKNTVQYKLGKKVVNKTTDKLINKGLNSILKKFWK